MKANKRDAAGDASGKREYSVLTARTHQIFQSRFKSPVPSRTPINSKVTYTAVNDLIRASQYPLVQSTGQNHPPAPVKAGEERRVKRGDGPTKEMDSDLDSLFKKYRVTSPSVSSMESRLIRKLAQKKADRVGIAEEVVVSASPRNTQFLTMEQGDPTNDPSEKEVRIAD